MRPADEKSERLRPVSVIRPVCESTRSLSVLLVRALGEDREAVLLTDSVERTSGAPSTRPVDHEFDRSIADACDCSAAAAHNLAAATGGAAIRRDWIDRTWRFATDPDLYPEVLERLWGNPARLEEFVADVPAQVLTAPLDYDWTIQENIGHLGVLDGLFEARIDDYLNDEPELRPADMTNEETSSADHNSRSIDEVLAYARATRESLVSKLENLEEADFARSSYHARLGTRMRLIDQCVFQATHDDYHLSVMRRLLRSATA